jgi:hypothetical protein
MQLEIRLDFGHSRYPSTKELLLGELLHRTLYRKGKPVIDVVAEGTDHGSVYSEFECRRRDLKKALRVVGEILRELSVEHLATITEQQPLPSPKEPRHKQRPRQKTPLKNEPPPRYLTGRARTSSRKGPAQRLFSGKWCGHGRDTYAVFDVCSEDETSFRLRLPQSDDHELNPPLVLAVSKKNNRFSIYDSREHVASIYAESKYRVLQPRLRRYFHCPKCKSQDFHLAVGFEYPSDREGPNDTSWFALAVECVKCKWMGIVYEDETQ